MEAPRSDGLLAAVETLRAVLGDATLPLQCDGADTARADLRAMVAQLDDYLLPRLRAADAPMLAVVGGSTGAGKSTLFNSLLGTAVSPSGVLRPTTRAPVLAFQPGDERWFVDDRILPGLARVSTAGEPVQGGTAGGPAAGRVSTLRLAASAALPPGLALLDAPDIDSVVGENRDLAAALLAAADLWIFVTTAARYADQVPWDFLADAAGRRASTAIVLNRAPDGASTEIYAHLRGMLVERDLAGAPLFTVAETTLDAGGLLPHEAIAPLRGWLFGLAEDAAARADTVRRTLSGAVDSQLTHADRLVVAIRTQSEAAAALAASTETVFTEATAQIRDGLVDGTLLHGEVLARWQELVGTAQWMQSLQTRVGRARDRVTAAVTGRPRPAERVGAALGSDVAKLLGAQASLACDRAYRSWRALPGGPALAAAHPELAHPQPGLEDRVARLVRDWQGTIMGLVSEQGKGKRVTARVLSYGVNGLGVALMLVVFSQTAGLTGAEVGIAGGTAVLAQRVLEAVFGDQAVRSLAAKARDDLVERAENLLGAERARFEDVLAAVTPAVGADRLRSAVRAARRAR